MATILKGGQTIVKGVGSTNVGPTIPMRGLVMVIDPAIGTAGVTNLRLQTPATSSNFSIANGDLRLTYSVSTSIQTSTFPTGGNGLVFGNTNGRLNAGSAIYVTGSALQYLQNAITDTMTVVVWHTGLGVGLTYPNNALGSLAGPSRSPDTKFGVGYITTTETPTSGDISTTNPVTDLRLFYGASRYYWPLQVAAFPLDSRDTLGFTTTNAPGNEASSLSATSPWLSIGAVVNQTASTAPRRVTGGLRNLYNLPAVFRGISMYQYPGRPVYNTYDTWNCFTFTFEQSKITQNVTSSVYNNGNLVRTFTGVTASVVSGSRSIWTVPSISSNFSQSWDFNVNGNVFDIGNVAFRWRFFATSSGTFTDTVGFNVTQRNYYFAKGATEALTAQNLVTKINTTPMLSGFFTASVVGTDGFAISSSVNGYNPGTLITGSYSGSTAVYSIGSRVVGTVNTGTGPITTNILGPVTGGLATTIDQLCIGQYANTILTGQIGAVYIYDRILTPTEVAQIYDSTKAKYGNIRPSNQPINYYSIYNPFSTSSINNPGGYRETPIITASGVIQV